MSMLVFDERQERRIRAERQASGADRWDEVWDGVYTVMPLPNNEHQEIVGELVFIFRSCLPQSAKICPGVNVSDNDKDWENNYRGPDVVVFFEGTTAINRGTHWFGGPDFAVEVVSKGDRSRKKLDFYASVNVRELLLVDRFPRALELYRLRDGRLELVGRSRIEEPFSLQSEILPMSFRLVVGEQRPVMEVAHHDGERRWSV